MKKALQRGLLFVLAVLTLTVRADDASPLEYRLRVQLHWMHQSQFAGFYMAQERGLFKREGLTVELIPGGPGVNPVKAVQEGRADIAVAWMSEVAAQARSGLPLTNVAQIAQLSSLGLLCRSRAGIVGLGDIQHHAVGYWGLGDDAVVRQMAQSRGVDPKLVRFEPQAPNAQDLINGKFACVTAMAYNEKLLAEAAGLSHQETLWLVPEAVGLSHLEDGLYVRQSRLSSTVFQGEMVRFVRALREGWAQARAAPSLALEYTLKHQPTADREHQRQMLEATLAVMPPERPFGLLSLAQFEAQAALLQGELNLTRDEVQDLWTHQVFNSLTRIDGKSRFLLPSTHHYLKQIQQSAVVQAIVIFGAVSFSIAGFVAALRAGYGLWGRLVLALVWPLGGGFIRDLLVGGDRLPLYFMKDPKIPLIIISISLVASLVFMIWPRLREGSWSQWLEKLADVLGVSIVALTGVIVALEANLHWFWAILCASISVAGGGIIRDLLMNREPVSMRRGIDKEVAAALGAAALVLGLSWANRVENSPIPVYLSMAGCVMVSVSVMLWAVRQWVIKMKDSQARLASSSASKA